MALKGEVQRFLNDVDSKIFRRGLDYYRSGMVERISRDGNHVTAEVSGSEEEPYLVEVDLAEDGEIEDWACDCPYDWGPVCKHVVAALLALQDGKAVEMPEEPPEDPPLDAAKRKALLEALVGQAEKERLAALVLEHCQEDKHFQSRVVSELEDAGELEMDSIRELVKESIRANTRRGFIDESGCDDICADLDDALDKARRRTQRGQWSQALEITQFVLMTGMKLASGADSSSGSLGWTIDAALDTVELAANGLAESGNDRTKWATRLLKTARNPVFDGWSEWRYALLRRTAVLANEQNEGEFYETLSLLSDRRWEAFKDAPRYDNQDQIVRYYVIRYAHGQREARAYLERNLAIDEFQLLLIRDYMEEGDYVSAERLCRERLEKEEPEKSWYRPSRWQYQLYEVYRDAGQREKQIQQARNLALMGDKNFSQITKELLMEDER